MKRRLFPIVLRIFCVLLPFFVSPHVFALELRVLAHNSFSLPKPLLTQFEAQAGVKLSVIKGGAQREAAARFMEFMRSPAVQEALQTSMWMFPAEPGIARAEAMRHAIEPASFDGPSSDTIAEKDADWVSRWTKVVLK